VHTQKEKWRSHLVHWQAVGCSRYQRAVGGEAVENIYWFDYICTRLNSENYISKEDGKRNDDSDDVCERVQ
jgi:hypothetical protein